MIVRIRRGAVMRKYSNRYTPRPCGNNLTKGNYTSFYTKQNSRKIRVIAYSSALIELKEMPLYDTKKKFVKFDAELY